MQGWGPREVTMGPGPLAATGHGHYSEHSPAHPRAPSPPPSSSSSSAAPPQDTPPLPKISTDPMDVEAWYPLLCQYTFRTHFIDLPKSYANALINCYEDEKFGTNEGMDHSVGFLRGLEEQLQEAIRDLGGKAFIRLSTRCPSDVPLRREKTKRLLKEELRKINGEAGEMAQCAALLRAVGKSMCVESAEEAMDFLLHSEIVYKELFERILAHEDDFTMKVVVREWVDIDPEWEFRAFVCNRKLTALTQHCKLCYVPGLLSAERRRALAKRVQQCWDCIQDKVEMNHCVVDFAFTRQNEYLVDLNPFDASTDGVLFDWQQDKSVLRNGPFEFRVAESPPTFLKARIDPSMANLMIQVGAWRQQEVDDQLRQLEAETLSQGKASKGSDAKSCLLS
ncbi:hypothetical protein QOT17_012413 [Balamuthia mandrillaris]